MLGKNFYSTIYIIVFCSCFTYAGTLDLGIIRIFPSELLFYLVLLPLPFILKNRVLYKEDLPIMNILLLFVFIHFISIFYVIYTTNNQYFYIKSLKEFIRIVSTAPFVIVIIILYRNKVINIIYLVKSFVYSGLFVSLYVIYQVLSVKLFSKYVPIIPNSSDVPNMNGRGVGTFMEGGYAVLFLGISLGFLYYLYQRKVINQKAFIIQASIILLAMLMTKSTAGIIAGVFSIILYNKEKSIIIYFFRIRTYLTFILITLLLLIVYYYFKTKLSALFYGLYILKTYGIYKFDGLVGDFSAADRLIKILKGYLMFLDHPFFGVGLGQYGSNYVFYPPTALTEDIKTVVPLNIYIEILAELGIIGFSVCLLLIIYLFFKSDSLGRALISFILINFMTYPSYKMFFIWVALGIIYLISLETKRLYLTN